MSRNLKTFLENRSQENAQAIDRSRSVVSSGWNRFDEDEDDKPAEKAPDVVALPEEPVAETPSEEAVVGPEAATETPAT